MNYKDTLNLPQTKFAMKANLTHLEPNLMSYWDCEEVYELCASKRKNSAKFVLHDGPPYANGLIHIGHALNKILKDMVVKYHMLRGYDAPYVPGWDCHGLPVEHQLFKELKRSKHDVDVVSFRKQAREFALKYVDLHRQDFKRLGLFGRWEKPYLTLDPAYEHRVLSLLSLLAKDGYIYRGRKPVNWCCTCETALAEAEVEYADESSDSIYFLFAVVDGKNKVPAGTDFLVWTTTPWTLVSNVAVAANPNLTYELVEMNSKRFLAARELIPAIAKKCNAEAHVLASYAGRDLEGISLAHPFLKRAAQVVLADFVSHEDGSGCVHIAPGHGAEDFSLVSKYDLPMIMPVNEKGRFEEPDEFKGKSVQEATVTVLERLSSGGRLLVHEKIQHAYPHCWRCKSPIIFRATFQWFMNVGHNGLREKLLAETQKVTWIPASGKERMIGMLATRPDWCLSRQRLWGIPIPALRCLACGEVVLEPGVIDQAAAIVKDEGTDCWFIRKPEDFLPQGLACPKCGKGKFEKQYDILDVWFESGASFYAVLKNNPALKFPADMYLEGSDQHRGWFQVSLIPSTALEGQAPFKTVLTHGFVVDGDGRKMSKSLGNVVSPQDLVKKHGAEILRLWAAYSDYSEDVRISDAIVSQLVDIYRKVRNTIRFIMGNLYDFEPAKYSPDPTQMPQVDRLMMAKLALFGNEVIQAYEEAHFYRVCQKIFGLCNMELSSFYLDILKDRLYTLASHDPARRSAQFVLYHIIRVLLKVCAPIMSFTAEEAYLSSDGKLGPEKSIFLEEMEPDFYAKYLDLGLLERWENIFSLRQEVLKEIENKRTAGLVGSSLDAKVALCFSGREFDFFKDLTEVLREVFIVSQVRMVEGIRAIIVDKADGIKCPRCWNWYSEAPVDELCPKCRRAVGKN